MSFRDDCIAGIDFTDLRGLEFGAADRPWIPPTAAGSRYVDHLTTEELRAKYTDSKVYKPEDFCTVHFVNDGRPLKDILGDWLNLDIVAAAHVIEHVPNVLQWLHDIAAVLKPGGELILLIPNKRQEFDRLRKVTETNELLANFLDKRTEHSWYAFLDYKTQYCKYQGNITWNGEVDASEVETVFTTEGCFKDAQYFIERGEHRDIHVSVFSPYSFVRLMYDLTEIGMMPFELTDYRHHEGEMFARLKECPMHDFIPARLQSLRNISRLHSFSMDDYYSGVVLRGPMCPERPDEFDPLALKSQVDELHRSVAELQAENDRLKELSDERMRHIGGMENSASWRLTKGLRALRGKK